MATVPRGAIGGTRESARQLQRSIDLDSCSSHRILRPASPKIDRINDPGDWVEAENGKRNPGPALPLGEEPGQESVDKSANDHASGAGFHEEAQNEAADKSRDAKVVAPPESFRFRMAALEAAIENERHD